MFWKGDRVRVVATGEVGVVTGVLPSDGPMEQCPIVRVDESKRERAIDSRNLEAE